MGASRRFSSRPVGSTPVLRSPEVQDGCRVDALTSSVMRASWRDDALCAVIPETFAAASWQEQCGWCASCPVVEVCFWAALIEERGFRVTAGNPPGVRGGVEGGRRRFILGELDDAQLAARYDAALADYRHAVAERVSRSAAEGESSPAASMSPPGPLVAAPAAVAPRPYPDGNVLRRCVDAA